MTPPRKHFPKAIDLIDAQSMHRLHPKTFKVPSHADLLELAPGDVVKVCARAERFWVTLERFVMGEPPYWEATVDNYLLNPGAIGANYGDRIIVEFRNILSTE